MRYLILIAAFAHLTACSSTSRIGDSILETRVLCEQRVIEGRSIYKCTSKKLVTFTWRF